MPITAAVVRLDGWMEMGPVCAPNHDVPVSAVTHYTRNLTDLHNTRKNKKNGD